MNGLDSSCLDSCRALDGVHTLAEFDAWYAAKLAEDRSRVRLIPFAELDQWEFEAASGDLRHRSGKFFRIEGLAVSNHPSIGKPSELGGWEQPIINQPEVGILGIITRMIGGLRHFLMQVKMEPGNVNTLQISPTLQATRSNYTQVHKGKLPAYLEYFLRGGPARPLYDRLQAEQGARFLRKRNRNVVLEVDGDIPLTPDHRWFTLGQLKALMRRDDLVNMDARSVLSCVPVWRAETGAALHSLDEVLNWYTLLRTEIETRGTYRPLKSLTDWEVTDRQVRHRTGRYFSVVAVSVESPGREVAAWTQPLVMQPERGIVGFVSRRVNGVRHVLARVTAEAGTLDVLEIAPTVSCSSVDRARTAPYGDLVLDAPPERVLFDAVQSEEGGRFFQVRNRYVMVEVDQVPEPLPPDFIWLTLGQLSALAMQGGYVHIDARNFLAALAPE